MMAFQKKQVAQFIVSLYFIILVLASSSLPFFWDCMLYSRIAQWFIHTGFESVILPQALDTGHSPVFPLYLASFWKLFGETLFVSHLLMLPFLIGIGFQLINLAERFFHPNHFYTGLLILLIEPTFLAQSTMVSLDIAIVFFYLLGLNGILNRQKFFVFISVIFLSLLSLRGVVLSASLFFTHLILFFPKNKTASKEILRISALYIISGFIAFGWYLYHYSQTGWMFFTPSASWSAHRGTVDFAGALKNIAIIVRNLLDFGRIALWIAIVLLFVITIRQFRTIKQFPATLKKNTIIICVPLVVQSLSFIPFSNAIGHRYFMIVYLLAVAQFFNLLKHCLPFISVKIRKAAIAGVILFFLSGHFWVYPDKIAKGWDSSLAHLPYFDLRDKMMTYIEKKQWDKTSIGSEFPMLTPYSITRLQGDSVSLQQKNLKRHRQIIYSNVCNNFSEQEIDSLKQWEKVMSFRKGQVKMILYQKPKD